MQASDISGTTDRSAVSSAAVRPTALPVENSAVTRTMTKVPAVTVSFWLLKVLTTGMGETASDFLTHRFDPMIAVGGLGLAAALGWQFSVRRCIAAVYWLAAAMVSVFGTMAADALHIGLGMPYAVSTVLFTVVLVAIFAVWYRTERTLSVHSINSFRREAFYWATVLATFALGTAAGDLTANTLHWGYFASGVLFAVVIALPAVAYRRWGLNAIAAFWLAYIVTRPLGASFSDGAAVPGARGGLDLGAGPVTVVLAMVLVGLVAWVSRSNRYSAISPRATR